MPLNPPRPFAPLFPPKILTSKINLKVAMAFHAYRGEHIVIMPGEIYSREGRGQAHAVVREEQRPRGELVPTPNGIARVDASHIVGVVAPAIGVLEELAEVVQMEPGAESVPAGQPPGRVRAAGCA